MYFSPYHPIPTYIKKKFVKRWITVYDLIPIKFPQFFGNQSRHLIHDVIDSISRDDIVFCISESTKKDLMEYRSDLISSQVLVTYLAASHLFSKITNQEEIQVVQKKYKIPSDYILSVCTLEPRKNIVSVIKAFSQFISKHPTEDMYLVLVGTKGWDFDSIFEQINTNESIRKKVIITGYVNDSDLAPLYSGAICFIYPSIYEGFGLPPLEAMQCGVPVITSNNSSLPEVVGDAGILVDAYDIDAIQKSIHQFVFDPELREIASQKSILRSLEFSWENCKNQMIQMIHRFE